MRELCDELGIPDRGLSSEEIIDRIFEMVTCIVVVVVLFCGRFDAVIVCTVSFALLLGNQRKIGL